MEIGRLQTQNDGLLQALARTEPSGHGPNDTFGVLRRALLPPDGRKLSFGSRQAVNAGHLAY